MKNSRTLHFLITGVSSGFGRALADAALQAGHSVTGTVRSQTAKEQFEQLDPARATAIVLDVTDFPAIAAVAEHLADQLLLPMALAGGGSFTTPRMTEHLHSNIAVIEVFLPVRIDCREEGADRLRVEVSAN